MVLVQVLSGQLVQSHRDQLWEFQMASRPSPSFVEMKSMGLLSLPMHTIFSFVAFLRKISGGVLCDSLLKDVTAGGSSSLHHTSFSELMHHTKSEVHVEREAQTELRADKDFLNTRLMDSWFVHITSLSSEPSLLEMFYHGELSGDCWCLGCHFG